MTSHSKTIKGTHRFTQGAIKKQNYPSLLLKSYLLLNVTVKAIIHFVGFTRN